jgi:predicted amidohydrolase YtcJ
MRKLRLGVAVVIAAAGLIAVGASTSGASSPEASPCLGGYDLNIVNAHFLTLDDANSTAGALTVHNGRIADVGHARASGNCTKTINLHGRFVIPGLVDSHAHFIRAGIYPGFHADGTETATTVHQFLLDLADAVHHAPQGEVVTAIGGWTPNQLAENRLPTRAELDKIAPATPVYIQTLSAPVINATGSARANTRGVAWFAGHGVTVDPSTGDLDANDGFNALKSVETDADRTRNTVEVMRQADEYGLTTVIDQGGVELPGVPAAFTFNSGTDYSTIVQLWREHGLTTRIRTLFGNYTNSIDPLLGRLHDTFQGFGDDYLRVGGIGEQAVVPGTSASLPTAYAAVAKAGWTLQQHSGSSTETRTQVAAMETVNAQAPLAGLRWSLAHVWDITPDLIGRLKAMKVGVTVQDQRYFTGTPDVAGPPFRTLLDSGIRMGAGTDATNAAALDPWISMYYMTTGRNVQGQLINGDQTISRLSALRLYTSGSAYFSRDDADLGSIERGKLADLVVLPENPLTVSDEAFKNLHSVMTIVGGRIVYTPGAVGFGSR